VLQVQVSDTTMLPIAVKLT